MSEKNIQIDNENVQKQIKDYEFNDINKLNIGDRFIIVGRVIKVNKIDYDVIIDDGTGTMLVGLDTNTLPEKDSIVILMGTVTDKNDEIVEGFSSVYTQIEGFTIDEIKKLIRKTMTVVDNRPDLVSIFEEVVI